VGFAWGGEVVLNLRDARAQLVDRGIRLPVVENDDVWLCAKTSGVRGSCDATLRREYHMLGAFWMRIYFHQSSL